MNRATRNIVTAVGVMLGIAGINHGFFETLQGNIPTNGLIIQAIGDAQQMWIHGTEEAFTIVPNFLITGILCDHHRHCHHDLVGRVRAQEVRTNRFHPALRLAVPDRRWHRAGRVLHPNLAGFDTHQQAAHLVAEGVD